MRNTITAKLAGEAGWIDAERDAYGNPLALEQPETQPAVDGSDLVLTIDSGVQYLVERGLLDAIKEYKADSGYAIVQDPNTGAILAMANSPSFNPNKFNTETNYENFKNPAVTDVREPGSTMKILDLFVGHRCGRDNVHDDYGWYGLRLSLRRRALQCDAYGVGRADDGAGAGTVG